MEKSPSENWPERRECLRQNRHIDPFCVRVPLAGLLPMLGWIRCRLLPLCPAIFGRDHPVFQWY